MLINSQTAFSVHQATSASLNLTQTKSKSKNALKGITALVVQVHLKELTNVHRENTAQLAQFSLYLARLDFIVLSKE